MRNNSKPWWILSWRQRASVSRKSKDTEKKIKDCRMSGDWKMEIRLKSILRRSWWGIKRYLNK